MADYSHFFLHEGDAQPIEFTPKTGGGNGVIPPRDVQAHAARIRSQYEACVNDAMQKLHVRRQEHKPSTK